MQEIFSHLTLASLIDGCAAWGAGLALADLRKRGDQHALTVRGSWFFCNLFLLFLARCILDSWPSVGADRTTYALALCLPPTEMLWVEGLLKRPFAAGLRWTVFAFSAGLGLASLSLAPAFSAYTGNVFTLFALGTLLLCAAAVLLRERARLSLRENRFADAVFLVGALALPLATTDFIPHPWFGLHLGGLAVLLFVFLSARISGRPDILKTLVLECSVVGLKVLAVAVCVCVAIHDREFAQLAPVAALAAALLLLLTTMGQFNILALRGRNDSFLGWVRRLQSDDPVRFLEVLNEFPLAQEHVLVSLDEERGFDRVKIMAGLESRNGLVGLKALDREASQGGEGASDSAELARLLRSKGMGQAFRVHKERGWLFLLGDADGDDYQRRKLELVRSMAASLEAHDLVRRQEESSRQAQKMEALGRLASGVSHEFGNLLMVIRGYAGGLSKALEPGGAAAGDAFEILRAADRASGLVRELSDFGRQRPSSREPLDLGTVAGDSRRLLGRLLPESVELCLSLPSGPVVVLADRARMEQVVLNLVLNARDAMPSGGRIELGLSVESAFAVLRVKDDGHGMDEETLRRIFEPFFTTKPGGKGTGLGLSTVYNSVRQAGGSVTVASQPGQGSAFEVRLPLASAEAVEEDSSNAVA